MTQSGDGASPGRASGTVDLGIHGYADAVEIGRGGFAVVYRANRLAMNQTVAIKVLTTLRADPQSVDRFARERVALGALAHHPNIVTVYDGGTAADGRPYLVMEYLQGGSLAEQLRKAGRAPADAAVDIAVKLAGALETAHRAGVLHRDVKPENVLISRYGEPLLADFGIARVLGTKGTETGVVTATIAHAPPEILDGKPPTPLADVYSLASTVFTLLAGHPAFFRSEDTSVFGLIARVQRDPMPDLTPFGVPAAIAAVIGAALAKDPAARPPSALAFAERLREAQRGLGWPVTAVAVEGVAIVPPAVVTVRAPGVPAPVVPAPAVPAPTLTAGPPTSAGYVPEWMTGPPPPRRRRRRAGVVALAGTLAVAAAVVTGTVVFSGRDPVLPSTPVAVVTSAPAAPVPPAPIPTRRTTAPPTPAVAAAPVPPGATEEALLLTFPELDGGDGHLAPPLGDIATVMLCEQHPDQSAKRAEAKALLTASHYHVDTFVASFDPGKATTFMASLRDAIAGCAATHASFHGLGDVTVAGGDEAVRALQFGQDVIWVRHGDYVVETDVNEIKAYNAIDPALAPSVAARAVAKLVRVTS